MKKTLGGDRLGAGNKMTVELHNYERSTHNLGYLWRSTMSAGTLVPFLSEVALPGDTFDIDLNCNIMTHPTVGPLFGSMKVQLDVFQAPVRLYQGQLHNNKLGIGMKMSEVKLPILVFTDVPAINFNAPPPNFDLDNAQINPSCIYAYLGIRGLGLGDAGFGTRQRHFNGIPLLAYWDIYKNYYANKQEEIGAVIHTPAVTAQTHISGIKIGTVNPPTTVLPQAPGNLGFTAGNVYVEITSTGSNQPINQIIISTQLGPKNLADISTPVSTVGLVQVVFVAQGLEYRNWTYPNPATITPQPIQVMTFPLDDIDKMREEILGDTTIAAPFDILARAVGNNLQPFKALTEKGTAQISIMCSQEGLGLKTYNSDLFNNWLKTDWIDGVDGISAITAIDTSGGSFTIDTLNLSKKVYDMLNRIAVSGGSYDDWLDAVYTHDRYQRCESPMYMGGLIKELIFQEVISNAAAETDVTQPLGTLAGRGVLASKHKGGKVTIKVDEPSYILGIISITPRIDYSQGNKWDTHLMTMDDFHKPALDEIGFQELITEQMAWWDTYQTGSYLWQQSSAGKQPAWINYMTNTNKVLGNFAIANNEMFMVLNRRYEPNQQSQYRVNIKDLTTYIDPAKYNHIFAQTSLDAQNFWTQIAVDMTVRRKISAKLMPNL